LTVLYVPQNRHGNEAIDYIAAKEIIAPALNAMAGGPSRVFQQTTQVMEEAAHALASKAIESGDLRPDVDPIDLMRAIYGLSTAGSAEDSPAKARKSVDILLQVFRSWYMRLWRAIPP
jgi:hypothetical protein